MYLAWITRHNQIVQTNSHLPAYHASNTVKSGDILQQQQPSTISHNGGPSNGRTINWQMRQVSHQTAGVRNNGYQMPHVNMQNRSCNQQGGQYFPVMIECKNPVNYSTIQNLSDMKIKTCHQGTPLPRQQFNMLQYSQTTVPQPCTMSAPQHIGNNKDLYKAANQSSSKTSVSSTQATSFPVNQLVSVAESPTARYANNALVNNTAHGPHPSNHSGPHMSYSHINKSGQTLHASRMTQKTQNISTILDSNKTCGSPGAGPLPNINAKEKYPPILLQLIEMAIGKPNDRSDTSREVAIVHPLTSSCNTNTCASKSPTPPESGSLLVQKQKTMQQEHFKSSIEVPYQPQSKHCPTQQMQATKHADDHRVGACAQKLVTLEATEKDKGDNIKGHYFKSSIIIQDQPQSKQCPTLYMRAANHADDRGIGACAQKLVNIESPEKDKGDKNTQQDTPPEPEASVHKLSSLPTAQWTAKELRSLFDVNVHEEESTKSKQDCRKQIISLFYAHNVLNLVTAIRTSSHGDLIRNVGAFCGDHLTDDTVVLTQVEPSFTSQLKNFHVFKDGEVYSELPYSSSWLNKNELDYIDKEFGPNKYISLNDNQPDSVTVESVPSQTAAEVPGPVIEQLDHDSTDSDKMYSFEIKVMSPEEAKTIFEQGRVGTSQCMGTCIKLEAVSNTSVVDNQPKDLTATSSSHAKTGIQQFCCIAKWKEMVCRSETLLEKCQCDQLCTKLSSETEGTSQQMDCQEEMIISDLDSHSPSKRVESKSEEKTISSIATINWDEICNTVSETFELSYDEETDMNIQKLNESQPIIILENDATNLSSCERDLHNQLPDNEDCKEAHLKTAESCQSTDTHVSGEKTPALLLLEGKCEQAQKAPDKTLSPVKHQMLCDSLPVGQMTVSVTLPKENEQKNRKKLSCPSTIIPYLKKLINKKNQDSNISKSHKISVDRDPSESGRTVQLALFGSLPRANIPNSWKKTEAPPEVIYANISPFKRKRECAPTSDDSATTRIPKKACSSTGRMKQRINRKAKHTLLSTTIKKKKLVKIWHQKDKDFDPHLRKSTGHDRRKNEHRSQALLPIQGNVLKFSVLPNTFSFEDTSKDERETTECCPDNPSPEPEKERLIKKITPVLWSPPPDQDNHPVHHGINSSSSSVFAEFQKKYKMMSQPSMAQ
ncbi:uncharacterized protein LOC133563600 isoform X2 [Nerophis ophidion]|uniref:uncharacterized protein LOC133563600 isoform X2 n=1 Tax=Nerophis ophidion TaxID=159077 RepID=UPI002ADF8C5F|nr:uncharacterized protein LOC133563600 isoform X2 [Nerophis ophidion]